MLVGLCYIDTKFIFIIVQQQYYSTVYQSDHPICHTYTLPHTTIKWQTGWMNGWLLTIFECHCTTIILLPTDNIRYVVSSNSDKRPIGKLAAMAINSTNYDEDNDIINQNNTKQQLNNWWCCYCHLLLYLPKIQHILFIFSFIFIRCYN